MGNFKPPFQFEYATFFKRISSPPSPYFLSKWFENCVYLLVWKNTSLMNENFYNATNDSFLFPFLKNKIRCQRFSSSEKAVGTYKCHVSARLKKKFENYSTWEGTFYQSEWVQIKSSWVIEVVLLLMQLNCFVWPI